MRHSKLVFIVWLLAATVSHAYFTPQTLLAYLNSIAGKHTISGQFIERGPLDPITAIYQNTGKWLGLIGGDYYWYGEPDFTGDHSFNQIAIPYWQSGGLITLSLGFPNPCTYGGQDTVYIDQTALLTPGTTCYNNLVTILDNVAAGLLELKNSGVTVLLRPYHEPEGNWFWWGTSYIDNAHFIQLWQFTYNYYTNTKGLNNLLWVYAGNEVFTRYPGDAYVDIVGQDLYTEDPNTGAAAYNTMVASGKMVAICEFGPGEPGAGDPSFQEPNLISALKASMPRTVYWLQWWDGNAGAPGWGMGEMQNVAAALNDPWVLNRDNLALVNNPSSGGIATTTTTTTTTTGSATTTGGGSGTVVCVDQDEWDVATLTCPSGETISQVQFASFGTATGTCGNYQLSSCNAATSVSYTQTQCLGKSTCSISGGFNTFGDPCPYTPKNFIAQVLCSPSTPQPTPKPPTPAPSSVHACAGPIGEEITVNLACPSYSQTIKSIDFASFGTPTGSCGSFQLGSCNAATSVSVTQQLCLGKQQCNFVATTGIFGDPCEGVAKHYDVQVSCA